MDAAAGTYLASAHGAFFVALYAASREYRELNEVYDKGTGGLSEILDGLHETMTEELRLQLDPVVRAQSGVSPVIDAQGKAFERVGDATRSEEYHTTVSTFLRSNGETIARYSVIVKAREAWVQAVRVLGRAFYACFICEAILASVTGVVSIVLRRGLYDWFAVATMALAAVQFALLATLWIHAYNQQSILIAERLHHDSR